MVVKTSNTEVGAQAQQRGRASELRALRILRQCQQHLPWLKNVRRATNVEDNAGLDIVCELEGEMTAYVQVKSSQSGVREYLNRFQFVQLKVLPLIIIVINDEISDGDVASELVRRLEFVRSHTWSITPHAWLRTVHDIDHLNAIARRPLFAFDHHGAHAWAETLNTRQGLQGRSPWVQSAKVVRSRRGFANGGLVLLETVSGVRMFLKVLAGDEEARSLQHVLRHTFLRDAIIPSPPIDRRDSAMVKGGESVRQTLNRWKQEHYANWLSVLGARRPNS